MPVQSVRLNRPPEQDEAQSAALRNRLLRGLAQAEAGDLAPGSGEEAVRRAFHLPG
jgi:antitoxin ParD1/3/4